MRRATPAGPRRRPAARAPRTGARLPRLLAPLFWDHADQNLSLDRDRDLVVRRVLAEGELRHIRLLRRRLGDDVVRDVLVRSEARGISPQRIRFWQLILDIPARRADAWVRVARAGSWHQRRSG